LVKFCFFYGARVSTVKNEDVLAGLSHTFMTQINKELNGELEEEAESQMVVDKAVAEKAAETTEPDEEVQIPEATVPAQKIKSAPKNADDGIPDEAESVGFVIGADVADNPEAASAAASGVHMGIENESKPGLSTLTDKMSQLKMPKFTMPNIALGEGVAPKVAIGVAALLVLIGAGGLVEFNFHKAQLEVTLPSNKISDSFDLQAALTATGEGEFKIDEKVISKEQKKSIATSGQREVGEKAKGTVILNNFDDKSISYSAGTKITADSLVYTLDSDVTIASASSSVSTIQAETKEAGVTAEKIGPEYNIDKDKRLSVSGASSRNFAVAKGAFSGGTKKQLNTIAKKDLDLLEKEILDAEQSSLLDEVKAKLGKNESLIPDLTEVKIADKNFSGEVGQEAKEVSLTANVEIQYYVFDDTNLKKEVANRLKKDVPSGFEIDKGKLAYNIDNTDKNEGDVDMNVKGEATVVKTVDKKKLLESITGKNLIETRRILKENFGAEDVQIKSNSTPLIFLNSILPWSSKNIDVRLKSE
jgi:hypothetical protein